MRDAARLGHRRHRRDPGRHLRHGLRVHGRLDGGRRRREGHPGRRARARRADPADHRERVGRRPDAGGHAGPHAARQDPRRHRAAAPRRGPLHLGPVRPDHRRRLRLVRGRRRRQRGRAQRADRLRRRARPGRDHRAGAARGLPARRVPVPPRLRRPGRGAPGAARRAGRDPAAPAGPRRRRRDGPRRVGHARLPAALLPLDPGRPGRRARGRRHRARPGDPGRRRRAGPRTGRRPTAAVPPPTTPGRGSSWRATCGGRGRSSSSRR